MPSIIVLTQALTSTLNIIPSDEPYLLAGMKMFGLFYKNNYDDTDAKKAAESLKLTFEHVMTPTSIFSGCFVYYWSNHLSRFVRITAPKRLGNSTNITFTEAEGGNFSIDVHLDAGGINPRMNAAMPIGDHTTYLDTFNRLATQDYTGAAFTGPPGSTDFFAAATLISRCK